MIYTILNGKPAKFELGQTVATQGVMALLATPAEHLELAQCFSRHVSGDWGDVCEEDKGLNDASVDNGTRVLSVYKIAGERVWIITEGDRSVTTALLPDEY